MLADPIGLRNFAVSDDGKDVYFAAYRNPNGAVDTGSNIYRHQGSTKATTKLTNYKTDGVFLGAMHVAYPGTGTRVAYTLLDSANPSQDQVRLYDTATGSDSLLDTYKDDCPRILCIGCLSTCIQAVHMTRDGGTIFYAVAGTDSSFVTIKADGTDRTKLPVYQGNVAPSGQRVISDNGKVVFTSAAPHGPTLAPAATDVYVMNLDGTNIQQVTHLELPQIASEAVISADGSQIAFTLYPGATTRIPEIWSVRTDGTQLHRLSIGTTEARSPSISGDGKSVTFIQDNQVKRMTTLLDVNLGTLIQPYAITSLSISTPTAQILSRDGQQAALALNGASIYLTASGDFIVQWTGLAGLTRVYAPRVLLSSGIRSATGLADASVGSLMTAFGANLGAEELTAAKAFPLPTNIDGVELVMNGTALPLQATTPWQINAHVPQSSSPGESSFVVRGGNNNATTEVRATVAARDPEVIPVGDRTQCAAVYPGTGILADKAHPVSSGQILEVYTLGLGVTTPRVAAGTASPSNPPATADVQPRISVGDREADVLFSGLVPGLAGLYQLNIRVPSSIRSNPQNPGYASLQWINTGSTLPSICGIYVKE